MKSTISCIATAALIMGFSAVFGPTQAYAQKNKKDAPAPAPVAAAAPAAQAVAETPDSGPGPVKIRVVNVREVMKNYSKVKTKWEALRTKMGAMQTDVDALTKKATEAKDAYEKAKSTMTPEIQLEKETALKRQFAEVQSKVDESQRQLNLEQDNLMKVVQSDIAGVISKVGAARNIDLILNGSDVGTVLYSTPNMDLTQTVINELNKTN